MAGPQFSGPAPAVDAMVMDPSVTRCVRLQLLLFFSGWYDVLFALLTVYTGWVKWRRLKGEIPFVFMAANFFVCFVLEPSRLYLGTAGNVREGVPELSLFVVLSILIVLIMAGESVLTSELGGLNAELELNPEQCSIYPERPCVLPLERACWIVRAALAAVELCLGAAALRRLIREKSRRFFVALRIARPQAGSSRGGSGAPSAAATSGGGGGGEWGAQRSGGQAARPPGGSEALAPAPSLIGRGGRLHQD